MREKSFAATILEYGKLDCARTALRRFLLRMTISKPQYEDYYSRYAPRTHGLPPPVPLHDFPRGREFYKKLGAPKKVVAPMVDQSELVISSSRRSANP